MRPLQVQIKKKEKKKRMLDRVGRLFKNGAASARRHFAVKAKPIKATFHTT